MKNHRIHHRETETAFLLLNAHTYAQNDLTLRLRFQYTGGSINTNHQWLHEIKQFMFYKCIVQQNKPIR